MAAPPKSANLKKEDVPEAPAWFEKVMLPLNDFLSSVSGALAGRLTRKENMLAVVEPISFTTAITAADTFPLRFKNKLPGGIRPTDVRVTHFSRKTGAASAAWSITSVMGANGEIEITFQGLENSTDYVGTLIYEA